MADFTTIANFKQYLGLVVATDDVLIASIITAVSAWVENYLTRNIHTAQYVDTVDGSDTKSITFDNYPITAVSSVIVDGKTINASSYRWRNSSVTLIDGCIFSRRSIITVTYTAGYASIPVDLAQACIEIVAWRYKERDRVGQSSKSAGGHETVSYQTKDIPESAKTILNQYKRRWP